MDFSRSAELKKLSHRLIPGGSHTYAKGDDQYPELAPAFIARGQGCRVWDVDGNEFIEYGMGLRAVTLGHAYAPVIEAVEAQLRLGVNFTRPAAIEIECAQALLGVIEGAEQVKFTKDGSNATTAAVKLARAYTGRDLIGICGDHPFFSTDDWFIGSTAMSAGIPQAVRDLTVKFRYNDIGSVERLFSEHPNRIAGLILEPARLDDPKDGFLQRLKEVCHKHGAVLIFDEMITGFRWHLGGGQGYYGVVPDLSCFGKALANGFAVSALLGRRDLMDLGGIYHDRERVFLLSTTHGAETQGLAACLATLAVYQTEPVIEHLWRQGERLREGINSASARHGLLEFVQVIGKPCNLVFTSHDPAGEPSQPYRTLLLQELLRRGVLAPSLVVSYSHDDEAVDRTIEAFDGALAVYKRAMEAGADGLLIGQPSKVVFRKFC